MTKKSSQQRRKARKKKQERRKRKRAQIRSRLASRQRSEGGLHARLRAASNWPLLECLVTEIWQEPGELVQILVARRSSQGSIVAGAFLVDLGCLGVKKSFCHIFESYSGYSQLRADMQEEQRLVSANPNLAAKIIREGVAYADRFGFEPAPGYQETMLLLSDADADACDVLIPLGREGKPFFVSGPHDDVSQILTQLEKAAGPDGFDYLVLAEDPFD